MNAFPPSNERVAKDSLLASLPAPYGQDLLGAIQHDIVAAGKKIVVIDDDPTGTQTVHDIPVLTEWSVDRLAEEMANDLPAFYLLTNTRSCPVDRARAINREIGMNLLAAEERSGRRFVVVSRSDSTLRGHFAEEIEVLEEVFEGFDGVLVAPFFEEGGRLTIDDVHYVAEGEWLVPVGQTQFAHDACFGYRSSNLRRWIEEKYKGEVPAEAVVSISLADIRGGGPSRVSEILTSLQYGSHCVINAVTARDLQVVVKGLLQAEAAGRRFLYRTAASFVAVRVGLEPRPLLNYDDLRGPTEGGALIVVGSYIAKSSEQLNHLLMQNSLQSVEVNVDALLSETRHEVEMRRVVSAANEFLQNREDVVIYTSRILRIGKTADDNLNIHQRVSDALASVVHSIGVRPRYLLAKGGITSSDVATKALGVKRAMILGQILPGVPVWKLGPESSFPDLNYIVFPGNVGGPDALSDLVSKCAKR